MGKRYSSPKERADQALSDLWNAVIDMCKRSHIGWGENDRSDPDYEEVMLTLAKQIYSLVCDGGPDGMSDDQAAAIAAEAFQEMVDKLKEQSGNIVSLPTTA